MVEFKKVPRVSLNVRIRPGIVVVDGNIIRPDLEAVFRSVSSVKELRKAAVAIFYLFEKGKIRLSRQTEIMEEYF
jgi:hypothetical protein